MKLEFQLMVFLNALFVALYLLWNWSEYSILNGFGDSAVVVKAYYPWYIQFSGGRINAPGVILFTDTDTNYGLAFFFLAILVNLYLAYRLQRKKETKQLSS